MPTFELTGPNGGTYHVDAPDENAALTAFNGMNAPQPKDWSINPKDIALGGGVGLAEGGMSLAGLPADAGNIISSGVSTVGNRLGFDPESIASFKRGAVNLGMSNPLTAGPTNMIANGPTGAQIKNFVQSFTGELPQPTTELGKIAQTAGEFAPNVLGGPEAIGAKLLTRVAAPVAGSEIAGRLTEGTSAEPYARAVGGLVGAVGGSSAANRFNAAAKEGIPTVDDLKAAARAGYKNQDVRDVQIKPEALGDLATKIERDLQFGQNSGFRSANEPAVFRAVDELRNPLSRDVGPNGPASANTILENIARKAFGDAPKPAGPANVDDIDSVRQLLNNLGKERDGSGQLTRQAVAANRAVKHIDDFLPNLKQADLLAGDAAKANAILSEARGNWGAAKRAENVQNLLANAEINAASANSGGNIQNSIKQAFKPMLKNGAAKAVGYNDEELAALNNIVRGTWTGSAARAAGNLLGGGGGLGMLASGVAGYEAGGAPGAIAAGLAGRGLKMIGNRSTFNAVAKLDNLLRQRSPEAIRMAAQNPQLAQELSPKKLEALRAIILSNQTLRYQLGQPVGNAGAQ